jgi:hypothetical protein
MWALFCWVTGKLVSSETSLKTSIVKVGINICRPYWYTYKFCTATSRQEKVWKAMSGHYEEQVLSCNTFDIYHIYWRNKESASMCFLLVILQIILHFVVLFNFTVFLMLPVPMVALQLFHVSGLLAFQWFMDYIFCCILNPISVIFFFSVVISFYL